MPALRKAFTSLPVPAVGGIPPVGTRDAVPGYRPEMWAGFYATADYAPLRSFLDADGVRQPYAENYRDYKLDFEKLVHSPPLSGAEITRLIDLNLRGQFDPDAPYAYFWARYNVWLAGPSLPYPLPQAERISVPTVHAWDTGALTTDGLANRATFSFTTDIGTFAAVGLAQPGKDASDPHTLDYAFLFRGNKDVAVIESGTIVSLGTLALAPTKVFAVRVVDGAVTYLVDGVSVRTTSFAQTADIYWRGAAALFGARSNVVGQALDGYNKAAMTLPKLVGTAGGNSAISLPKLTAAGGRIFEGVAAGTLPRLRVMGRGLGYKGMQIPKLQLAASGDGATYAQASMTLPALSAVGYAGRPALIGCMAILPRVEAIGVGTSGTVGSGALTLPKLIMRSANFAEMRATMPKLRGLGIQEPANEAFLSGAPLMTAPLSLTALVTMQVDSAASITSDAAAQTVVAGTLNSAASVTSDLAINAVFNAALDSVLIGAAYQSIDGDSDEVGGDQTWVVNAETSASSVYEGFAFNSYAVIGGQLYGARSDGLYLLEGDDDDGVPIRASMSFGSTSFGTAMLKRMESAYIGVSSAGTMYLKVILKDGENYTYAARRSDGFQAQQRFDVGRGIRASHLTFELYNSDGCDFELNTVTFVAAELTRKV